MLWDTEEGLLLRYEEVLEGFLEEVTLETRSE